MYLEYFGFQEEPFNITPNSKFLFLSQRHREALAALLYGIEQRKGFIALTGHIGCGKTTICRAMLGKLDRSKTRLALVLNPEFNDVELLQTINGEFGLDAKSTSKRELLDTLNRFLLNEYKNDRNVVLLIDEAQRLPPDALEQVRLISNLETETAKLIQIALVGQPELADLLDLPELEQLNQRITVRYHIEPLSLDEVAEYVNHRIAIARRLNINNPVELVRFTKKALRKVYEYSGGVPRRVNVVSDRSLLVTFVREQKEVSEENVEKAIEELGGMPKRRRIQVTLGRKVVIEQALRHASGPRQLIDRHLVIRARTEQRQPQRQELSPSLVNQEPRTRWLVPRIGPQSLRPCLLRHCPRRNTPIHRVRIASIDQDSIDNYRDEPKDWRRSIHACPQDWTELSEHHHRRWQRLWPCAGRRAGPTRWTTHPVGHQHERTRGNRHVDTRRGRSRAQDAAL